MTKLDDEVRVIAEFGDVSDGTSYVEHGMAREIMRFRRILAVLREPSEKVLGAALRAYSEGLFINHKPRVVSAIVAAVAVAEKEVGRE